MYLFSISSFSISTIRFYAMEMKKEWEYMADLLDRNYPEKEDDTNYKYVFLFREQTFDAPARVTYMPGVVGAGISGRPQG